MQIKIEDISHSGSGVGKIDGKVIFVPYTDIGEIVEIKNIKKGSKFDKAEVAKVLAPSKDRCVPSCPYFSNCGGCDFQFVNYERELKLKELILKNELKKVNFFEKIDIFSSKNRFFYRNKIKLSYFEGKLGYYSADKNFVEVEYCPLAKKEIDYAIKVVKEYLKVYKYQNLKSVTFRKTDEIILISFLFSKKEKLKYSKLLDNFIIATFIGDILESDKTKLFERFNFKGTYKTILNEKIPADFNSFFQVNDEVAENLYRFVLNYCKNKKIINAYSGQGALSLLISKESQKVVGIEIQKSAHLIAEKIKKDNMKNINGAVEQELPKLLQKENYDLIVLDPAREGCKNSVIEAIKSAKIKEILYISCNFSTLVRDLKSLNNLYYIKNVSLFDMFPNTANMEVCVTLSLKKDYLD